MECYRGEGQACHTKETTITLYPVTTYTPGCHTPTYTIPYQQKTETYVPSYPSQPAPCHGKNCDVPVAYPSETVVYHTPPPPPAYSVYPGDNTSSPYVPPQYTGTASSVMPKVGAMMALAAAIALLL